MFFIVFHLWDDQYYLIIWRFDWICSAIVTAILSNNFCEQSCIQKTGQVKGPKGPKGPVSDQKDLFRTKIQLTEADAPDLPSVGRRLRVWFVSEDAGNLEIFVVDLCGQRAQQHRIMALLQQSSKKKFLGLHLRFHVNMVLRPHSELLGDAEDLADYEYGTVSEAGALRQRQDPGSRCTLREWFRGHFWKMKNILYHFSIHLGTFVMPPFFIYSIYSSFRKQCFRFMMTERHDLSVLLQDGDTLNVGRRWGGLSGWVWRRASMVTVDWQEGTWSHSTHKFHSQTGDYPMGWTRRGQWPKFLFLHSFSFIFPGVRASKAAKRRCSQGPWIETTDPQRAGMFDSFKVGG